MSFEEISFWFHIFENSILNDVILKNMTVVPVDNFEVAFTFLPAQK